MPAVTDYQIDCNPNVLGDDKFPEYLEICKMFETMTRIYIEDAAAFSLEAEGIILQVFARLIRNFSRLTLPEPVRTDLSGRARIRHVISYVEEHFMEPLSLSDISAELGIGREYFCRFFKKNMGISFLNYLNEVRLTHVYQDLTNTDLPIAEIMENNGITNQKFFNKAFRKLYGCTPSAVRTAARTASPIENSQVNIALK
jgi:AraC-like DNA-binding protein